MLKLSACQLISPLFVDYNGVRMDIAAWINQQTLLTMQQKRALVEFSKAQQRLFQFVQMSPCIRTEIAFQNETALYCARQIVSPQKIQQFQNKLFAEDSSILNALSTTCPSNKCTARKYFL